MSRTDKEFRSSELGARQMEIENVREWLCAALNCSNAAYVSVCSFDSDDGFEPSERGRLNKWMGWATCFQSAAETTRSQE
jgi:hypothetical protein